MELAQKEVRTTFKMLSIFQMEKGKYQPRRHFDKNSLQELAETIKNVGILEPLLVRPKLNSHNTYEIIAGERRWRAAQLIGLQEVPCLVGDYTDEQAIKMALIENLSRKDLNPIEEAGSIQKIIDEFGYTHEEIATTLGKSRTEITHLLRLLRLDDRVQKLIIEGGLTEAHGKILAGLPSNKQYPYANKAALKDWSSRALEKAIKAEMKIEGAVGKVDASPDLQRLELRLSEHFGASVKFDLNGKQAGCVKIHFHSLDELDGILQKMGYQEN